MARNTQQSKASFCEDSDQGVSLNCVFKALDAQPRLAVRDGNVPVYAKQSYGSAASGKENQIVGHVSHSRRLFSKTVNVKNKAGNSVKTAVAPYTDTVKTDAKPLPEEFLYVSEYSSSIIEYLLKIEKHVPRSIHSKYAANHNIVVDWLTRVQHRLALPGHTLHTAVSLLDTAICMKVSSHKLQLVACTALWIAAKCDMKKEVPRVSSFCSLSEFSFSKSDMYAMEVTLLNLSDFNLLSVNPLTFVSYYLHTLSVKSNKVYYICNYLLDIIYQDINFSTKRPSLLAAAAVYAMLRIYQRQYLWKEKENKVGFCTSDKIQTLSDIMLYKLKNCGSDTGPFKKYNSSRYNRLGAILNDFFKSCSNYILKQLSVQTLKSGFTTARLIKQHTVISTDHMTPEIKLHLITPLCELWTANSDNIPFQDPFWAFYWPGGQAIARYILDNPQLMSGRRVLDVGSGSGACAIAAVKSGALNVTANDIDPVAATAIKMNANLNAVNIDVCTKNLVGKCCDKWNCILLGDMVYDAEFTGQLLKWLSVISQGKLVLLGDPGRQALRDIKNDSLTEVARYRLPQNACLENRGFTNASVWRLV